MCDPELRSTVADALSRTMQVDLAARRAAEERVNELQATPGFAVCLAQVTLDGSLATGLRQLAALVLKQLVRAHWCEGAEGFVPPAIADAEKAAVRAMLPAGLGDGTPKIRTAVSMAIAGIAQWDWPDAWPGLMGALLAPLQAAAAVAAAESPSASPPATDDSADAVAGVLRCLEMCAAELQEEHLGEALSTLMPLLHTLVAGRRPPPRRERARAVRVLHRLLERLVSLCDDEATLRALQRGPLTQWAATVLGFLGAPPAGGGGGSADADEPDDHAFEIALLRLLRLLIVMLPRSLSAHSAVLVQPLGRQLLAALQGLEAERGAAEAEAGGGCAQCDSEGSLLGTGALVAQLLDVFSAMANSSVGHELHLTLTLTLPPLWAMSST